MVIKYITLFFLLLFSFLIGKSQIKLVDFTNSGETIACCVDDTTVFIYENKSKEKYQIYPKVGQLKKIEFLGEKNHLIITGKKGSLTIFNLVNRTFEFHLNNVISYENLGDSIYFSQNNNIIAYSFNKKEILWSKKVDCNKIVSIALSKKKNQLAIGSLDGTIRLIDLKNHNVIHKNYIRFGTISAISFDHDASKLIICSSNYLHIYNSNLSPFKIIEIGIEIEKLFPLDKQVYSFIRNDKRDCMVQELFFLDKNYEYIDEIALNNTIRIKNKSTLIFEKINENSVRFFVSEHDKLIKFSWETANDYTWLNGVSSSDTFAINFREIQTSINNTLSEQKKTEQNIYFTNDKIGYSTKINKDFNKKNDKNNELDDSDLRIPITAMLFTGDSKYIITTSRSKIIRIWDSKTNIPVNKIKIDHSVLKIAMHPLLPILTVLDEKGFVSLIDLNTFNVIRKIKFYNQRSSDFYTNYEQYAYENLTFKFNKSGNILEIIQADEPENSALITIDELFNNTYNRSMMKEMLKRNFDYILYNSSDDVDESYIFNSNIDTLKYVLALDSAQYRYIDSVNDTMPDQLVNIKDGKPVNVNLDSVFLDQKLTNRAILKDMPILPSLYYRYKLPYTLKTLKLDSCCNKQMVLYNVKDGFYIYNPIDTTTTIRFEGEPIIDTNSHCVFDGKIFIDLKSGFSVPIESLGISKTDNLFSNKSKYFGYNKQENCIQLWESGFDFKYLKIDRNHNTFRIASLNFMDTQKNQLALQKLTQTIDNNENKRTYFNSRNGIGLCVGHVSNFSSYKLTADIELLNVNPIFYRTNSSSLMKKKISYKGGSYSFLGLGVEYDFINKSLGYRFAIFQHISWFSINPVQLIYTNGTERNGFTYRPEIGLGFWIFQLNYGYNFNFNKTLNFENNHLLILKTHFLLYE